MIHLIQLKTTTSRVLIPLVLVCFALLPKAQAVVPAPDGGYPGGNTAEGQAALLSLTTGGYNTAVGYLSLRSDTSGAFNTGIGAGTLLANTANRNTATGAGALLSNADATDNTANGAFALLSNTTGARNTAVGAGALFTNTGGSNNTAVGVDALHATTGSGNTANGFDALSQNTTGTANTAVGTASLAINTTGNNNTAVGVFALLNSNGDGNIALGNLAGTNLTSGSNNIYIGHAGSATQNNSINIGVFGTHTATFIAGIHGVNTNGGIPVYIDGFGQLGTTSSSRRFKKEIKPMDNASEAILALKPVTFHYKSDKTSRPQFGLIAEEVAEVNPDLVARDQNGEIYTVRYDEVNAMLLNEFLKEHRKVEKLEATVSRQQKQIEALILGLQKVSALVEMSGAASQVAANTP
jgi:endosialidase-like protein